MNTHRQLGMGQANGAKSMEKLSSGFRINRAGDDAAGLSISEKMRAQIRGLNQGSRNAQDGISMIQTAEGALQESQAILQRMRELAVQSANDTNVDIDRGAIQNEINQLKSEVDRIGNTTEFNTQSLLKGDGSVNLDKIGVAPASLGKLTGGTDRVTVEATNTGAITTAAAANDTAKVTINGQTLTVTFAAETAGGNTAGSVYNVASGGTDSSATVNLAAAPDLNTTAKGIRDAFQAMIDSNDELKGNFIVTGTGADVTISAIKGAEFEGNKGTVGAFSNTGTMVFTAGTPVAGATTAASQASKTLTMPTLANAAAVATIEGKGLTINGVALEFYDANKGVYEGDAQGINISGVIGNEGVIDAIVAQANIDGVILSKGSATTLTVKAAQGGTAGNSIVTADGGVQEDFKATFQIGANQAQTMDIKIGDMRSAALGIDGINLANSADAQKAITTINEAIEKVSAQRSELGAFQNRLEHTIKNLDTSSENLQASESRIRDIDMAKEMMEFTKNNILTQAAQAMLAQANQQPQGILQLLR